MFEYIEFIVCYGENLKPNQVKSKTREAPIVFTRQLIMYFCKEYKICNTLQEIGDNYNLDHATVLHSIKSIKNYIETDKEICSKIKYYDKLIKKVVDIAQKEYDFKKLLGPLDKQISELESRCINLSLQVIFMKSELSKFNDTKTN